MVNSLISPDSKKVQKIAEIFQDDNPAHQTSNRRICVEGDWLVGTLFSNSLNIEPFQKYQINFKKQVSPQTPLIFERDSIKSEISGFEHVSISNKKSFEEIMPENLRLLERKIVSKNLQSIFPNLIPGSFEEDLISNYCIASGDLSKGGEFLRILDENNLQVKRDEKGRIISLIIYNQSQIQTYNSVANKSKTLTRRIGNSKLTDLDEKNPNRIKVKIHVPFYLTMGSEISASFIKTITCSGLERKL